MQTNSVLNVAKAVILKSPVPVSNLKLQKLLYYVQGWSLAIYDKPAFTGRIEAWVHGPVVPVAFHTYRHFGWNPIRISDGPPLLAAEESDHIQNVLDAYGQFSASELETLSHSESPWLDARGNLDPKASSQVEISNASMKAFFSKRMND